MTKDTEADIGAHDPNEGEEAKIAIPNPTQDAADYLIPYGASMVLKYGRAAGFGDADIRTRLIRAFDRAAEKGA